MCKYCVEYGNGTKWYLNPANFDPELVKKPGHAVGYMNLTGTSRNSFEWGGKDPQGPVDMGNEGYLNMAVDTMLQQAGQVIPLEDALQIIDVAPGDRFILQHCGCRRYFGFGDFYGCMFFDRDVDRTRAELSKFPFDKAVFTKEHCIPDDHKSNIVGKVVVLNAEPKRYEYQHPAYQLILAEGGNGATGGRGQAVFGTCLATGERARWERYDVLGEIKPECMPDWAKEALAKVKGQEKAPKHKDLER